jgi:flagellar biosynthetic protein FliP
MSRAVLALVFVLFGGSLAAAQAQAQAQAQAKVEPAAQQAPLVAPSPVGEQAPDLPKPNPAALVGAASLAVPDAPAPKVADPTKTAAQPDAVQRAANTAVRDALKDALNGRPNPTLSGLPESGQTSEVVRIALVLSLLVLIPAVAICMTPFVRIIVVLSMIRHAFGMPETPPNQVLISLALFMTAFTMMPTLEAVNTRALEPFLAGSISVKSAVDRGSEPVRTFMLRQVHDQDIKTVYDMKREPLPGRAADVSLINLTPAFMLNELRVSFKIGFVIFLPFLLIDIVVASVLLSLGMLMVPPATISLPIKILMFVLIDGWGLVLQSVVGSIK